MNAPLSLLASTHPGRPDPPRLPARVLKALEREQYRAELLVTFVQLAIVVLLALFYVGSPPGFSPDTPIEAAPLGLVLFGELALLRLYFARTGRLSRPILGITVVAEMMVLLCVLWAYHLQYEQSPQFSLKSSQFAYIFVLIGLRALRFEPLWVVLSGLTAALGWGAILTFALLTAPENPVTWDVVTSLRSTQIHLGGEFDRLLAIVVVTTVLALALARARRLLGQAVSGQQAAADLSLFFDDSVARRITESEADVMPGQGELREAAILFLDLRGFTHASATLTPTGLIDLLGEYQGLMVPIVKAHGGSIDKFMGDGILASFGAVTPDPRYAARALDAVDAIMDAANAWRARRSAAGQAAPDVGAGLATGEVVFGIIGEGSRLEYTVIGDPVNLAAKLEKHNKAESTRSLTTRVAFDLARSQGYDKEKPIRIGRSVGGVGHLLEIAVLA
ncbi:MAG: adenylate/guanylate cyclase domain-containing protein [Zoogloeaceae bacterium]|nr:adenylate/guanylate cyclase domain-containing protein [Zoogloeaceae bacterium]